jgi:hypothetical protein
MNLPWSLLGYLAPLATGGTVSGVVVTDGTGTDGILFQVAV